MVADILVIDDEADIRELVSGILDDEGYETRCAADSSQALDEIESRCPSLVFLDIWLQGSELDGLQLLEILKKKHPELPVVMISGHGNIETAVVALKQGAYDYLEKPFKIDKLILVAQRAIETSKLKRENETLKRKSGADGEVILLRGISSGINNLRQSLTKLVKTNSRVMLFGGTGSGREEVSEYIHQHSLRASGPFISMNASSDQDEMEAFLFGSVNEVTGENVLGALERAHGGTLYINEITETPLSVQKKLVNVLSTQTFMRVGGKTPVTIDVRVISSSAANIEAQISEGQFREDLYHRLCVVPLNVPSLTERRDDIPVLAESYADSLARQQGLPTKYFSQEALIALQAQNWPGNIYQLKNYIEQILILYADRDDSEITSNMLPEDATKLLNRENDSLENENIMSLPLREAREAFEREYLTVQVERFGGNISKTSEFIGMERSALHRKLKSLGLT